MIRKLYNRLTLPVSMFFCLKKYNGIWGLKRNLFQSEAPNARHVEIYNAYFAKTGSWIGYTSQFANVPFFPHGCYGVFISAGAKIGKNAIIFQHVTIGSNALNGSNNIGSPVIGDNVYIGAGAKIVGKVIIGDNCRIGANAVVYQDLPPNSVAVQSPTRVIQKSNLDNRYYSLRNGRWFYFRDGDWIEDKDKEI